MSYFNLADTNLRVLTLRLASIITSLALIAVSTLLSANLAISQTWESIGKVGIATSTASVGRISAIAVHPTDSTIIYIASSKGGVWKTINGGTNWTPMSDSECTLAMGDIIIDPVDPNILVAGTGESHNGDDDGDGCGLLISSNAGVSWTNINNDASLFGVRKNARVEIRPGSGGNVATFDLHIANGDKSGHSTDGGTTWTSFGSSGHVVSDIVIDPVTTTTNYIAIADTDADGVDDGIWKSTNGGTSYTKMTVGLPSTNIGRIQVGIASSAPATLYSVFYNYITKSLSGVYQSKDSGANWSAVSAIGLSCDESCLKNLYIYVDPVNSKIVYIGGASLYKSVNEGANFTKIGANLPDRQHGFTFYAGDPSIIYAANTGGIYLSTNAGSSWISINGDLAITAHQAGISVNPTDPDSVLSGTRDNHTIEYNGSSWEPVTFSGNACDGHPSGGGKTGFDADNPLKRFAQCEWVANSSFSGPRASTSASGDDYERKVNGIDLSDRASKLPPFITSPSIAGHSYFGTHRIYKTTDYGETWTIPLGVFDFTGGAPHTITAIAESKGSNGQAVLVGTSDGKLYRSVNAGALFVLPVLSSNSEIRDLDGSRFLTGTRFLMTQAGTGLNRVSKGDNSGGMWSDVTGDLPFGLQVFSVATDPTDTTTYYAGTSEGVYKTTNNGTNWASFGTGLPFAKVVDLKFDEQDFGVLYAATEGRGMFKIATNLVGPASTYVMNGLVGQGAGVTPASKTYTLTNTSSSTSSWTAADNVAWLSITPSSGSLTVGSSVDVIVSTLSAVINPLSAGTRVGTITFTDTNTVGNITREASLTLVDPLEGSDNLADAETISGTSGTSSVTSNAFFTNESFERSHFQSHTTAKSAWWKWLAPSTGQFEFDTSGSTAANTVISAYVKSGDLHPASLSQIGTNDDSGSGNDAKLLLHAQAGVTYYIAIAATSQFIGSGSYQLSWDSLTEGPNTGVFAAIVPYARSVQNGGTATALALISNASATAATSCYLQMPWTPYGSSLFSYQTVDGSNQLTGTPNTPVDIAAGASQGFVFALTPSADLPGSDVDVVFDCANKQPVSTFTGVNTFILSSSANVPPDMLTIAVTTTNDGIVNIPGNTGAHLFVAAVANIGATGNIEASVDTGAATLPLTTIMCRTNTENSCIDPPSPTVNWTASPGTTYTFTIFVTGTGNIPFDPANNRMYLRFKENSVLRGASGVAVRTQ